LVADFPANFNVGSREQDMIRSVDEPSCYPQNSTIVVFLYQK
jgi:hypothetical protein